MLFNFNRKLQPQSDKAYNRYQKYAFVVDVPCLVCKCYVVTQYSRRDKQ